LYAYFSLWNASCPPPQYFTVLSTSCPKSNRQLTSALNRNTWHTLASYWSRCDKPPLAVRYCHVANDLRNFTGDRRTNEKTDRTSPSRKAPTFAGTTCARVLFCTASSCGSVCVHRLRPGVQIVSPPSESIRTIVYI